LETAYHIDPGLLVLTATDREKQFIEVEANLKYTKASSSGTYLCGIEFIGNEERVKAFITNLIKEYNVKKNNLFITLKENFYRNNFLSNPHTHTSK